MVTLTYLKDKLKYYFRRYVFISVVVIENLILFIIDFKTMCSSLNANLHLVKLKPSPAYICHHVFEDST